VFARIADVLPAGGRVYLETTQASSSGWRASTRLSDDLAERPVTPNVRLQQC
jgi:hypothetical protein